MNDNIQKVKDLMATLGVTPETLFSKEELKSIIMQKLQKGELTLDELSKVQFSDSSVDDFVFQKHGILEFASYRGKHLGVVVNGGRKIGCFVVSLKDFSSDALFSLQQAQRCVQLEPKVKNKSWIIPTIWHFNAISNNKTKINEVLTFLGGQIIRDVPYLTAPLTDSDVKSTQSKLFSVRLVLPL